MTSVSPPTVPAEWPIHVSIGGGSVFVMWIGRVAPAYSNDIRMKVRALDNLKGERQIHRAWDARKVTLDLRVELEPVRRVLFSLG